VCREPVKKRPFEKKKRNSDFTKRVGALEDAFAHCIKKKLRLSAQEKKKGSEKAHPERGRRVAVLHKGEWRNRIAFQELSAGRAEVGKE